MVSKGTMLAKLYDGDLQATLNKLQVQLKIAEQNEERSAQLLKIQGINTMTIITKKIVKDYQAVCPNV